MEYQPTEAVLHGLHGEAMAADEAQAAHYDQLAAREEWERQAWYHHHEQEQQGWDDGEYEQMMFDVEGF
ncbi:hypothetical protein [Hymenobacter sp. BT190]|uniref:hypothetical protein n=1 Tax=Hymenobacter sp. BT190 TaxID=2763505 RepID=UPI00165194DE|nr:hypothetical protein [Hymenobacter sp. BT190]MBC6697340.1 hypothetical protein [Hymenobacter sp. BT190]